MSKKTFLALLIFLLIFILLGIPFAKWGFISDDAGNIMHARMKSFWDFLKFFYEENIQGFLFLPNNMWHVQREFFSSIYRPLEFVYFIPQWFCFGTCAYGYYLVLVFSHALNSVLLFYLFSFFTNNFLSFLGALFFAFHCSFFDWFGWLSTQHYQLELTWILLLIFSLKKYLDSQRFCYYLYAIFFLFLALFTREVSVIVPVWILFAVMFYTKCSFLSVLKNTIGFWFATLFYLIIRLSVFPITSNTSHLCFEPNLHSFFARFSSRFFDLVSYLSDIFGFCWLPSGNRAIKGFLILVVLGFLLYLFIKNKYRFGIWFGFISLFLFSWLPLLTQYRPRYLYLILPFFIFIILWGLTFFKGKKLFVKMAVGLWVCLTVLNGTFLFSRLKLREDKLHKISCAIDELLLKNDLKNKPLFFIGLPIDWFWGIAQNIWIRQKEPISPIYCELFTYSYQDYRYKTIINVEPIKKGFSFKILEPSKNSFGLRAQEYADVSTGKVMIKLPDKNNNIYELDFIIDEKWLKQNPIFITWDYWNKKFIVLKKISLLKIYV